MNTYASCLCIYYKKSLMIKKALQEIVLKGLQKQYLKKFKPNNDSYFSAACSSF